MTYKYSFTFPISGANKLLRFKSWAAENAPAIDYHLPPQVPIEAQTMTVRLRSLADRDALIQKLSRPGAIQ